MSAIHVSSSPHVRSKDTTSKIMLIVIIALLPSAVFGIVNFGLSALLLIVLCVGSAVASEWLFNKITKRRQTIGDLSAVVTGLLLAMNLPPTLPWWEAILGSVFAIVIVKCLFGGLGQNFMNPALGARCFLIVAFAADMTKFSGSNLSVDTFTGATPLAILRSGDGSVNLLDMFLGKTAGTIGETSGLLILIGAIIMLLFGVIDFVIPGFYLLSFVIFMLIFSGHGLDLNYLLAQVCGGGLLLGAFFMATDYVTSPITPLGKLLFGICCGVLTGIFRCFGANAEGVSFAIILSNLLVPLIEKITIPRAFGVKKEAKKNE